MKIISVLNHKGGVGKSTISTNLAGYYANNGGKVLLGDFDIQQSSVNWLELRPSDVAEIQHWEFESGRLKTPPADTTHIIIDSPAGIDGLPLKKLVSLSDKILVPLKPSIFDIMSTQVFLSELVELINYEEKEIDLCVIGNMVEEGSKPTEQLKKFIKNIGLESPTFIRNSTVYVSLAAHGVTLFDSPKNQFRREKTSWQPLINWLEDKGNYAVQN